VQEILSFGFDLPLIFEAAILHYIDGAGRKYISRIVLRRFATSPNTEYIFFQLAVNIMQNRRLKIAISL